MNNQQSNIQNSLDYNRYKKLQSNPDYNRQGLECFNTQNFNTKVRPSFANEQFNRLDYDNFTNSFTRPRELSKEIIEYEYIPHYIFINSGDRDRSKFPSPSNFKIDLPDYLCDVTSVSIAGGTIPNLDSINSAPFLYLDVPELNHIKTTSRDSYFGILSLHAGNTSTFFNLDKSSTNVMPHVLTPIKQRLDSLHIKILHPTNVQINLGTQSEVQTLDYTTQTSFVFQVITRRKKRQGLDEDYRNTSGLNTQF
jgi:hypothetical protein